MSRTEVFAALLGAVALAAAASFVGYRTGQAETVHALIGIADPQERRAYAIRYGFGLEGFNGLYGQDLWVLHSVFPDVRDGYFVDLGSADGVDISNTKRLEDAGWTGVCIDPFPRNMSTRRCVVYQEAVDSRAGRVVRFQAPGSFAGGIVDYAGWWVPNQDKRRAVELRTSTLADILERASAPAFIHYMNVDIEGAEYEALKDFPFERYRFGALTVEHNNLEDRRRAIRGLLERNGYRLKWAIRDQDWYVPVREQPGEAR